MSKVVRRYEIRRRRKRQAQQRRIKAKLAKTTDHNKIEKLVTKLRKISLAAPLREFLQAANQGGKKAA